MFHLCGIADYILFITSHVILLHREINSQLNKNKIEVTQIDIVSGFDRVN